MHAVLNEFNHNYADTMTAEAYARYALLSCHYYCHSLLRRCGFKMGPF